MLSLPPCTHLADVRDALPQWSGDAARVALFLWFTYGLQHLACVIPAGLPDPCVTGKAGYPSDAHAVLHQMAVLALLGAAGAIIGGHGRFTDNPNGATLAAVHLGAQLAAGYLQRLDASGRLSAGAATIVGIATATVRHHMTRADRRGATTAAHHLAVLLGLPLFAVLWFVAARAEFWLVPWLASLLTDGSDQSLLAHSGRIGLLGAVVQAVALGA